MDADEAPMIPPSMLEEDNSLSGLSDCLVELEVEADGEQEIPFRSYLDENGAMCGDVQDCHSPSDRPLDTPPSCSHTVSHPLLSPGSVQKHFIPHGQVQRCIGSKNGVCPALGMNQQPQGNYPTVQRSMMSPENRTPTRQSFLASGRNSRTPNTLMRLQEKHRQNERVRHHTLIKNMKAVCSRVPGYDEKAKETKVVMLQRVVDYICHIEQHIQGLSDELCIKHDLSNTFLMTKIRKTSDERNKQLCSGRSFYRKTEDPILAAYIPESIELMDKEQPFAMSTPQTPCGMSDEIDPKLQLRRQKISSPTVGSSSDATVPLLSETMGSQSSMSSEDSAKPAPSNIPFVDEMTLSPSNTWISQSDDIFSLHPKDNYLNPEESLGFEQSDDFGMSSPFPLGSDSVLNFGASSDHLSDDHLVAVSPDQVLQVKSGPLLEEKLLQLIERKKESYLNRPPLTPITNMMRKDVKGQSLSHRQEELPQTLMPIVDKNLRSDIGRKDDDYFVSYVPYMWKFHNMAMTRRQKAAAARTQSQTEKENGEAVVPKKSDDECKPVKVDLRKTSWMNGFMMFSRINRRTFIEANPGVHTSHISKMMGHTWRNMLEEEQRPYKEKAKKYMEYMQRSFEEPLSESETRTDAIEAEGDISLNPVSPRDQLRPLDSIAQVVPGSLESVQGDTVTRFNLHKYKKRRGHRLRGGRSTGTARRSSLKSCSPGTSLLRKCEVKQEPSEQEKDETETGIPSMRVKAEGDIILVKQDLSD